MNSELEKLDKDISDLIDMVDIGTLNDIYLDAILNTERPNGLSVAQKRNILKFVLSELEGVEYVKQEPEEIIIRSEPINIPGQERKNLTV